MSTAPAHGQECPVSAKESFSLDPASLAQAFESFTHVAGTLETSYTMLQGELARLRHELEVKNQDLARSLAENQRMQGYLAGLLEALPCGVLAVDQGFRLCFANPQAQTLLELSGQESSPGAPASESLRPILSGVAGARPAAEGMWKLSDGQTPRLIAVTCAVQPQSLSFGERVFILRDVTEQKRLEEEREFAQRMKALAEMTALLAHEIRNPLESMELFAGLIREASEDGSEVGQWIIHIQAGLRALAATVNNVLHFHSRAPLHLAPVDLVRLAAETVEFLQPLALERGLCIAFTPGAGEILIPGDTHRLRQVFFNLAINAFRAMPAGKRLKVRVSQTGLNGSCRARIDFEDEGSGIAPEILEKVFDPGFTTAKNSPGLGLAVCQRVTAQHRGTIEVTSKPGHGTTFSLYFPLLGAAA